jgi:hypothetical protein
MSNQQSKKSLKKKVTLSLNNHSVTYNRTRPSNKERQKNPTAAHTRQQADKRRIRSQKGNATG